ncbi:hypothetical protein LCGC14_1497860 [marine sediment metagenome]|uniref:Uncharacterized protein n=1 Tax=marine sediment metagenome TaxID=412755 RepID=A0A0F9M6I6_9ZZZZ
MEDFSPTAGLIIVTLGSLFMALVFFANGILINIKSKEKGWPKESKSATLWGFAFMILGQLGNHFLTR